jgi:stage II sporulation protein M
MINAINQEQNQQVSNKNTRELFQRGLLPYLLLAIILFALSLVIGLGSSPELTSGALGELIQNLKPIIDSLGAYGPLALILFIFLNNAIKALFAMILGIILGLPTLFFIGSNGFIIGITVAALQSHLGYGIIAASLIPHGIIEIPILLLTSSLGLKIGVESIRFLIGQKSGVKIQLRRSLRIYVKWGLTGLFVAAIIEVLVTPLIVLLAGGK